MLSVIFDWVEFTILEVSLKDAFEILELNFSDFMPLSKGRFGYRNQLKWNAGHIYVMFTAKTDEITETTPIDKKSGVHVMITGQGCRQYSVNGDLLKLVGTLYLLPHVNFSRIDLAVDDFKSEIISYDRINKAALNRNFTSRWSKWDEINSRQTSTGEFLGRTMYFGSQASDLFCRIYDKTLERKANSEEEVEVPDAWTRLEVVYRKDRAKKLVEHLMHGLPVGDALRGTLKQYLRFLTPSNDSNKARWPTASWWEVLLENVEKLQLTIKKESKSIEDMAAWVEKQIGPSLAAILKAHEGDLEWLRQVIAKGAHRLSQRHIDAINIYKGQLQND